MATYNFPSTIAEFGYTFNSDGELKKIDPETGKASSEGFQFNVKDDAHYNQKHYEALGELMTDFVYDLLDKQGLKRLPVPIDAKPGEPQTFIFATEGAMDCADRPLLLLVHGSGVVRAGQWARSLIINDKISTGTQIPYIEKAKELGYEVLVLNTNDNYYANENKKHDKPIKDSDSPEAHFYYVWDHYVKKSKAKNVAIVAHSYGGQIISYFSWDKIEEFREKVFAVAMTDSVHYCGPSKIPDQETAKGILRKVGINWRASSLPLDTPIKSRVEGDVPCVSAGHPKHEMTSASAINSVFQFIEEKRSNLMATPDVMTQQVDSTLEQIGKDEKNVTVDHNEL